MQSQSNVNMGQCLLLRLLLLVELGMGRFEWVSASSTTRPMPIRFEQFQPAINIKNSKPIGYLGRMDRVCTVGLVGLVRAERVERIFSNFLHLSHFHFLHCLPAISLKPTTKSLPSDHLLQAHKSTNPQTQTNQKRKENEIESERKR